MKSISLDGAWQLYYFPEGKRTISHPDDLKRAGLKPVEAEVPGNVEVDLMRAGLLPDIYQGNAIHLLRPFERCEWWYLRDVMLPADCLESGWQVVFEGLDPAATVWLNDVELGRAENMLVEHRFDASQAVRPGWNQLAVRIGSALEAARRQRYDPQSFSWEHRGEGLHIRKAPHVWGWDILPRLVSAGIWRPVRLEMLEENTFEWIYYWTAGIDEQGATLGVRFQFRAGLEELDGLHIVFEGVCGQHSFCQDVPVEFIADGALIRVENARLWWPKGYGDPALYTLTASLCQGQKVLAQTTDRIGLRIVELDYTDTAGGCSLDGAGTRLARLDRAPDPQHHFVLRVNGVPVMVKGTNWVPLDALHSRDATRLPQALALLDDLGGNMVRCWGGNVYESSAFFDFCDSHGILVWQDFAFACAAYPQDEEFLKTVGNEVQQVAARLRNHAALALWCGDNEIDMLYRAEGLDPTNNRLTRQVIPQTLQRCDPHRPYLPSSPYWSPAALQQPGQETPEQHLWGPRGYYKSPFYTHHSAHFISEIGYHGCPEPASLRRFLSPEHLWPWQGDVEWQTHSVYHWQHHGIQRDRIQLMADQVRELFGHTPEDLESFAQASQIVQAEAVKFFIESSRIRKWDTSGVLWWNLLDGWPQFSDAVVDYYFAKKLAYAYIWRSQRPVCVMIHEAGAGLYLPVVVCNDTRADAQVHYRIWEAGSQQTLTEGECVVPANQNWQVERLRTFASDQKLYLIRYEVDGTMLGNHYLAGTPPFDLGQYRRWLADIAGLERAFQI